MLQLFIEIGADSLDLHALFEAGGNDPTSRERVLDIVARLVDTGDLESRGGDFYLITDKGNGRIVNAARGVVLPEIIRTLIGRQEKSSPLVLPEAVRIAYGGDQRFPPSGPQRPYVIGNFVNTVDGVVSYEIEGISGGSDISGFDESDRFIMGLLRASADAVMVGSGTLHQTAPEHLFVAESVFPAARDLYTQYRSEALKKTAPPLQVIVSGSGRVDLTRAIFRTSWHPNSDRHRSVWYGSSGGERGRISGLDGG